VRRCTGRSTTRTTTRTRGWSAGARSGGPAGRVCTDREIDAIGKTPRTVWQPGTDQDGSLLDGTGVADVSPQEGVARCGPLDLSERTGTIPFRRSTPNWPSTGRRPEDNAGPARPCPPDGPEPIAPAPPTRQSDPVPCPRNSPHDQKRPRRQRCRRGRWITTTTALPAPLWAARGRPDRVISGTRGSGVTGSHAGFRFLCPWACGFESRLPHRRGCPVVPGPARARLRCCTVGATRSDGPGLRAGGQTGRGGVQWGRDVGTSRR
jgi:hypothetical protein